MSKVIFTTFFKVFVGRYVQFNTLSAFYTLDYTYFTGDLLMSTTLTFPGILSLSSLKNTIILCMHEQNIRVTQILYKRNITVYKNNLYKHIIQTV